ncbi:MAG: sodium:proton antiporter [Candidatus Marinimicrobia bacterium]|nr:sodium:proton antiporter [Candidatus Neomarinimicrobiota bacterium]MBL7009989.1 sodium:proton antiporter [Candidatus Neomarinimicrobiota bacterium]MBL7029699.1 sodium:proton antiporter [Candidatus Neomarinimicrobiota bacterium]
MNKTLITFLAFTGFAFASGNAHGAAPHLNGADLSILWVIPFAGILLSIAGFPLVAPQFWHHNFGKVSAFWAALLIIPFLLVKGFSITLYELLDVGLLEYIPFIILLLALFTISGGVQLTGSLVGKPIVNTGVILLGTILASWMGTTGAAMLLIRPLIRANKDRQNKVHVIVFFIFLVANIGGSLTPLGDPPLFLGFLKGVDFFWTTSAMFLPMLFLAVCLLAIFFALDTFLYNREENHPVPETNEKLGIKGSFNLLLLVGVIGSVLLSGFWHPHISFMVYHVEVELQNIARDILLLLLTIASWKITSQSIREANEYTWFPIVEVAKLFAGIFITIIPAIAILKAGTDGVLASVINSVSNEAGPINYMYFWATGILSSFLDNAPTYLVFFNTAGGDASVLMGELSQTLLAISAGAVFMGANTYIGNAPNFMVKSISESSGIEMPSFFGYLFKWSIPILIPLFILVSYLFF